jgi:hypothetical protein
MPAHDFPRRTTSTATSLTVTAPATTALQIAVQTAGFDSNEFLVFHGQTNLTAQYGLGYEQPHPLEGTNPPAFFDCDPTEDGASSSSHTAIDWAAKGLYDPTSKRVFWASCGAGNNFSGGYVYNTMPLYDETLNRWTVSRAFRGANETTSATPIVHMYDGNALDVSGRRFYRKKLSSREIMVYDLANEVWLNNIFYSGGEPTSYGGDAGMDWIPSRNRLWIRGIQSGTNDPILFEVDPAAGSPSASTIAVGAAIGGDQAPSVCIFNPRAFGGAGACFIGGPSAHIVRVDTWAISSASSGKPTAANSFTWPHRAHACRDPVGDGWLYACDDGFMYRLSSAGVWSQRAPLPEQFANAGWGTSSSWSLVMVPIDEYGVVWLISTAGATNRAWLYKP